ncbi:hypothetical protein [Microbacterium elymi]|uniref:Uncharacterized protein n=1 Tax=Microbacterium elymi TaxID=2909587 RepID=A0ABY5NMQ5_9MICO|nr:hypothetical protein [Microbacterium elymi]UUT36413.1 hypothetical protein L2X98_26165 [Microbacterium elymi]
MPIDEAVTAISKLWEQSPVAAAEYVNTDVEGRRFYATAPTRVDKRTLDGLRDSVVALAEKHGFPHTRNRQTYTFDQELAVLFAESVPMLPVEAADEEVWAFITLSVLPDVAIWRWPAMQGEPDRTLVDDEGETRSDSRTERLLGRRRGVFRQAWWRGNLLGQDACLRLDEDNFINLTDRVSLTGYGALARLIVQAHLDRVGQGPYHRRFALRRALILIGREFGRIAVEALPEEHVKTIVNHAFDRATADVAEELESKKAAAAAKRAAKANAAAAKPDAEDLPAASEMSASGSQIDVEDSSSTADMGSPSNAVPPADARARFLQATAAYAVILEPMLVPVDYTTAMAMLVQAKQHLRTFDGDRVAARIYDDLADLMGDWASLDHDARSIVYAAITYFVEDEDVAADADPGGLLDDDDVVDCAFAALGRERHLS